MYNYCIIIITLIINDNNRIHCREQWSIVIETFKLLRQLFRSGFRVMKKQSNREREGERKYQTLSVHKLYYSFSPIRKLQVFLATI